MDSVLVANPIVNYNLIPQYKTFSDFLYTASNVLGLRVSTQNGGTGSLDSAATTDNSYNGKYDLATGTTNNNTGISKLCSSGTTPKIILGGGILEVEWRVRVPILSGSPAYTLRIGATDSVGVPGNGIYFIYNDTTNGGNWQCISRISFASTVLNSSIPVLANTWYRVKFIVNAAATEVSFYVDDVFVGTNTTGIPTDALMLAAGIEKSSTTTTSRTVQLDSVYYRMER